MENSERFGGRGLRHGLSKLAREGRQVGGQRAGRDETVNHRAARRLAEGLGGERAEYRELFRRRGDGGRRGGDFEPWEGRAVSRGRKRRFLLTTGGASGQHLEPREAATRTCAHSEGSAAAPS
jgi:hypothetical protein